MLQVINAAWENQPGRLSFPNRGAMMGKEGGEAVAAVPEEVVKEVAAAGEQPPGRQGLTSQEFFFLLQRIDRVDEKLSGEIKALSAEIKAVNDKLSSEIKAVNAALSSEIKTVNDKLSSEIKAVSTGLSSEIKAVAADNKSLEDRLTQEIKAVAAEGRSLEDRLTGRMDSLRLWAIGLVAAVIVGFAGVIVTLAVR